MGALRQILFVLLMLFAIGLHEFGHFFTAKRFGIKVEKFFIGFGPKIWSYRRGETEYGVNWLPFGGYVRIAGMNPFEQTPPEDAGRVFRAKPPWQRAIVLAAGSTMHFLLALVVVVGIFATAGRIDKPSKALTSIAEITPGSAASKAHIQPGDTIVAVGDQPVTRWEDVQAFIRAHPGETVTFVILRDGEQLTLRATLAANAPKPGAKPIGFLGVSPKQITPKVGVFSAVGQGTTFVGEQIWGSLKGIWHVFSPSTFKHLWNTAFNKEARRPDDPTSIVGLTRVAGGFDFTTILFIFVGFNIFVGVANLLPLPPLDGGHLAVLTYEKIRGRQVDMRKLIPVTATVMTLLLSLFVLLFYLDLVRPITIPG